MCQDVAAIANTVRAKMEAGRKQDQGSAKGDVAQLTTAGPLDFGGPLLCTHSIDRHAGFMFVQTISRPKALQKNQNSGSLA